MSNEVTYSPAYTLVPTYECFNRCSYCNFRVDPGGDTWITLTAAEKQLKSLQNQDVIEILILSGEVHPKSPKRSAWLQRIYDLCKLALSLGFLPHTNAGPLKFEEIAQLKPVNVSMGLMLEQLTPQLLQTVHRHAPSKVPEVRLQQLEWAGELQIPFTTGLLLGIGETELDWRETLEAIATVYERWGHIQEVILQPHRLGSQQTWQAEGFDLNLLPKVVAIARSILPPEITLQIPPNLITYPDILLQCIELGARDLGGISPHDEVNPDYAHLDYHTLAQILNPAGWELKKRLPVYPQYEGSLAQTLQAQVRQWQKKIAKTETCVL